MNMERAATKQTTPPIMALQHSFNIFLSSVDNTKVSNASLSAFGCSFNRSEYCYKVWMYISGNIIRTSYDYASKHSSFSD